MMFKNKIPDLSKNKNTGLKNSTERQPGQMKLKSNRFSEIALSIEPLTILFLSRVKMFVVLKSTIICNI
jgi:hypothetical protein